MPAGERAEAFFPKRANSEFKSKSGIRFGIDRSTSIVTLFEVETFSKCLRLTV